MATLGQEKKGVKSLKEDCRGLMNRALSRMQVND
jgi:hypothetical protein